jgi:probable F420-dependent oxidoreductase
MQLGLRLPHFGPAASRDVISTAAELAERDGWHSVWTSDRVAVPHDRPGELAFLDQYVRTYESLVTLAFVASVTRRVRLGTSAIVVPQRQLMLLARQVASLDALSGGRVLLGVAAGWAAAEFAAAGAAEQFAKRGRVLDEAILALRALWTASPAVFSGRYVQFPAVDFEPRPARQGGIPIVVAGNSIAARRRATRLGDGWNPTALGVAETAAGMAEIARLRAEHGRSGPFLCIGSLRVPPDPAAALALLRPYAEIGTDVMICAFTDPRPAQLVEDIRRFGQEVVPVLRSSNGT